MEFNLSTMLISGVTFLHTLTEGLRTTIGSILPSEIWLTIILLLLSAIVGFFLNRKISKKGGYKLFFIFTAVLFIILRFL